MKGLFVHLGNFLDSCCLKSRLIILAQFEVPFYKHPIYITVYSFDWGAGGFGMIWEKGEIWLNQVVA